MSTPLPRIKPAWIGAALVVVLIVVAALFFQPNSSTDTSSTPRTRATGTSTARTTSRSPGQPTRGGSVDPTTGLRWVELAALPRQAQQTVSLVEAGGPYPYSRDGIVFGNRESLLPKENNGWYHEYTVLTPGSSDRGARRVVSGGAEGSTVETGLELFYSDDHYDSFSRIRIRVGPS